MNLTSNGCVQKTGLSPVTEIGGEEEKERVLRFQQLLKIADLCAKMFLPIKENSYACFLLCISEKHYALLKIC